MKKAGFPLGIQLIVWLLTALVISGVAAVLRADEPPAYIDPDDELAQLRQRLRDAEQRIERMESRLTRDNGLEQALATTAENEPGAVRLTDLAVAPTPKDDASELPSMLKDSLKSTDADVEQDAEFDERLQFLEKSWKRFLVESAASKDAAEARPTVNWRAAVQTDSIWYGQSTQNRDAVGPAQDSADFRRLRIGMEGDLNKAIEYRIQVDFAYAGRPSVLDAWTGFRKLPYLGQVRFGHFLEPISLERYRFNQHLTFMERALPVDTFVGGRRVGIDMRNRTKNERLTWQLGAFRTNDDNYGDDISSHAGWTGVVRMTGLPWYVEDTDDAYLLHLGGSYSYHASGNGTVRFQAAPEVSQISGTGSVAPKFVDTGVMNANAFQLFGAEASLIYSSLSLQSEFFAAPVEQLSGPTPVFTGCYVYGSYFLTGEHRAYRKSTGVFERMYPKTRAVKGPLDTDKTPKGMGAWEVAVRWSEVNLDSGNINGNRLNDITCGVNWYLNAFFRIDFNYIHAMLQDAKLGFSDMDIYGVRFDLNY